MTLLMSKPLTPDEHAEILTRAEKLHMLYGLGGAYPLPGKGGTFVVDFVQNIGVWVYLDSVQVYADNYGNTHANHSDPDESREVLDALRRQMILDDLADV